MSISEKSRHLYQQYKAEMIRFIHSDIFHEIMKSRPVFVDEATSHEDENLVCKTVLIRMLDQAFNLLKWKLSVINSEITIENEQNAIDLLSSLPKSQENKELITLLQRILGSRSFVLEMEKVSGDCIYSPLQIMVQGLEIGQIHSSAMDVVTLQHEQISILQQQATNHLLNIGTYKKIQAWEKLAIEEANRILEKCPNINKSRLADKIYKTLGKKNIAAPLSRGIENAIDRWQGKGKRKAPIEPIVSWRLVSPATGRPKKQKG